MVVGMTGRVKFLSHKGEAAIAKQYALWFFNKRGATCSPYASCKISQSPEAPGIIKRGGGKGRKGGRKLLSWIHPGETIFLLRQSRGTPHVCLVLPKGGEKLMKDSFEGTGR